MISYIMMEATAVVITRYSGSTYTPPNLQQAIGITVAAKTSLIAYINVVSTHCKISIAKNVINAAPAHT